jgi:hypothetical protein
MSQMGQIERPAGWFSRKARAQRSAASRQRRQESAARREQEDRERAARAAVAERRLGPVKSYARQRLRDLAAARAAADAEKRVEEARLGRSMKPRLLSKRAQRRARNKEKQANLAEKWKHKKDGTPETHEHASRIRQGALARLCEAGTIDAEQLGWALEIAEVAEQIQRDVAVRTASLETRVDCGSGQRNDAAEGIRKVRFHLAYTSWRAQLAEPHAAILDMIIGEPIPFSTAARRYRIGHMRAKRMLIDAIDRWPECVDAAARSIDSKGLQRFNEQLEAD